MKRKTWGIALLGIIISGASFTSAGQNSVAQVAKQQGAYTLSLELEFSKKGRNQLQKAMSVLLALGPNGHATGFLVGDGLVMTAYHVVSGELSDSKKIALGFKPKDELEGRV